MNRFRTLPGVILNNDRSPLKRAEELAIVVGLAAARLRDSLDQKEEILFTNVRRTGLAIAAGILILAALGTWWMLNNGQGASVPFLIVGAVIALALVALGLAFAPYSKRFRVSGEQAAVTRVSRLYWPIGILPLGSERAMLWDPLTDKNNTVAVVDLPPTLGLEQETATANASKPDTALKSMLTYEGDLAGIAPEATAWFAVPPDTSMEQTGAEIGDLWKRMTLLMADEPAAVLDFHNASSMEAWRTIADEGERVHTFHQEIESLRLLTERYKQRAQHMVDRARELAVEHGFSVMQQVEESRAAQFSGNDDSDPESVLPVAPGAPLTLSVVNTAEQIRENLNVFQAALRPLDEEIAAEMGRLKEEEAQAVDGVEGAQRGTREQLTQAERNIAQLDSEILKLAGSLESYQQRMVESQQRILGGYEKIAQTPMAELRNEVQTLETAVRSATDVIHGATPKMDLPGLDQTLSGFTRALNEAHTTWQSLAKDLPQRGKEVQERLETIQASLRTITDAEASPEPTQVNSILNSVKNVERVARDMVNWTTRQQDPLSPVEDHDQELARQVSTLNDLRRHLEQAHTTFAAATSSNGTGAGQVPGLPAVLKRVENSLGEFTRLADESSSAAAALNNAAETVQKQASRIEQLIDEREQARSAYERRAAELLETMKNERAQLSAEYAQRRAALANRRAALNHVHEIVEQRLERTLSTPAIQNLGVIDDQHSVPWSELVVNQMSLAIDEWGKRVAGIDATASESALVEQVRDALESAYQNIRERSVATRLAPEALPLSPHICFVPFWYVETEQTPGAEASSGRMVHLFPPLHLDRPAPTAMPTIEGLRYREISRRLLSYLRRDFVNGADPLDALSFAPTVLTDAAKAIPEEAGSSSWQELATALAQHWVFFRSDDALLNRIVLNSRDYLLPAEQIVEAWLQSTQPPALPE